MSALWARSLSVLSFIVTFLACPFMLITLGAGWVYVKMDTFATWLAGGENDTSWNG